MKFLVIGLGSMGKRRIRCLQYLGEKDIVGFDVKKERCEEASSKYGIRAYHNFKASLSEKPDVFIISVPSNLHHRYALEAIKRKVHFFTESNFLPDGMVDLIKIEEEGKIVACPSFTMVHHPMVKLMKRFIKENKLGKLYFFTYHLAAYLPHWHPWEDYRNVYYSKKETPGIIEMIAFELTWIVSLIGEVKKVKAFSGKLSDLEIKFEDTYQIILEMEKGILGHMLIEIVSQPSRREMKIGGEKATLLWHSEDGYVKLFDNKKQKWEEYKEEGGIFQPGYSVKTHEEMYIEEMEDFLKAVRGEKKYPYFFKEEQKIINFVQKIIKEGRI